MLDNLKKPKAQQDKEATVADDPMISDVRASAADVDTASIESIKKNAISKMESLKNENAAKSEISAKERAEEAQADLESAQVDLDQALARRKTVAAEVRRLEGEVKKAQVEAEASFALKYKPSKIALFFEKNMLDAKERSRKMEARVLETKYILGNYTVKLDRLSAKLKVEKPAYDRLTKDKATQEKRLEVSKTELKRAEMETFIRKADVDRVGSVFKQVCQREADSGKKLTLQSKCCLAYVLDICNPGKDAPEFYENPLKKNGEEATSPLMQEDPDKVSDMQNEGKRLLLLKQAMTKDDMDELKKQMSEAEASRENATNILRAGEKAAKAAQEEEAVKRQQENTRKMRELMGVTGGANGNQTRVDEDDDDAFLEENTRRSMNLIEERLLRGGQSGKRRKF